MEYKIEDFQTVIKNLMVLWDEHCDIDMVVDAVPQYVDSDMICVSDGISILNAIGKYMDVVQNDPSPVLTVYLSMSELLVNVDIDSEPLAYNHILTDDMDDFSVGDHILRCWTFQSRKWAWTNSIGSIANYIGSILSPSSQPALGYYEVAKYKIAQTVSSRTMSDLNKPDPRGTNKELAEKLGVTAKQVSKMRKAGTLDAALQNWRTNYV